LERGIQIATPGAFEASTSLCARFTLLEDAPAPLRRAIPIRLHLYSSEALGTLRPLAPAELKPGETGIVELRLAKPVTAIRGDRFIIRRPSPQTTLGGGSVLDPRWRRRKGADLAPALDVLGAGDREALLFWVESAAERGVETESLVSRLGVRRERLQKDLEELAGGGHLIQVPESQGRPRRWLAPAAYERVARRAERVLKEYFQRNRVAKGIPKAEAVRRILPAVPAHLTHLYLSWLQERKVLELEGDLVTLPGRRVELSGAESKLVAAVQQRFEQAGLAPPLPDQVRTELSAELKLFEVAVRYLVQNGSLARLPGGFLMSTSSLKALCEELLAANWESFSVPQFKERFGLTRKFAIPILEHFDSAGVTRRAGDERIVTRALLPSDSRGETL
jgi:selenocysteine-specific elongation factor